MTVYWIYAVAFGSSEYQREPFGPFRSRQEAERTMTALAGVGKFRNIQLKREEAENEDDEE